MAHAEVQIHDYFSSHLITIDNGYSKIKDGTLNFIHIIDTLAYRNLLGNISDIMDKSLPPENPMYPILKHEAQQTIELLEIVEPIRHPRFKRSLDILGTAWKYLAGSPDHDDLNIINTDLDKLTTNNNKQVIINNALNNRMNKLTKITNDILNMIKKDNRIDNGIALSLQGKIRMIKEEIINIKYAIQWARLGIINSLILNKKEIELTLEELEAENMPFNTAEEALELADVSVLSNSSTILYIVKIPLTTKEIYNNYIIKAIIKNNVIINLKYNNILKNKETILGIKDSCKQYNMISICKQEELLDLRNDPCIPNLVKSLNSSCHMINSHHIPREELITPGMLFLNDFQGNLTIDGNERTMNGTYIVNFRNTTITVNGKTYKNFKAPPLKVMPAIAQPTPMEKSRTRLLSLEALSELHINNTMEIHSLRAEKIINRLSAGMTLTVAIILLVGIRKYFYRKKLRQSSEEPKETTVEANQDQEISVQIPAPVARNIQIFQTLEDKRF